MKQILLCMLFCGGMRLFAGTESSDQNVGNRSNDNWLQLEKDQYWLGGMHYDALTWTPYKINLCKPHVTFTSGDGRPWQQQQPPGAEDSEKNELLQADDGVIKRPFVFADSFAFKIHPRWLK